MKFTCPRNDLLRYLSYAESIVVAKSNIAILLNVLIEAEGNSIKLSATDFKVGITTELGAIIETPGSITVNAKKLLDIVKSFPPCDIMFSLDSNDKLSITADDDKIKANFNIKGIPKDDYPTISGFKEENNFEVPQGLIKDMIAKTIFSISHDEDRTYLNGIYLEKNDKELKFVATDGRRLALASSELENGNEVDDFNAIVPAKVFQEAQKILSSEGTCKVSISEDTNQIFFKIDNVELTSNLLEGQFPNYQHVIPKSHDIEISVDTIAFTDAIRRVSNMIDVKTKQLRLSLEPGKIVIKGFHPEHGEGFDEVDVEYQGESLEIAFNYDFLLDTLKEILNSKTIIQMTANQNPILLKGDGDDNFISIIMPMKLEQ